MMGGWIYFMDEEWKRDSIDLFFIPLVEKKICLAFVYSCTKLFFAI